MSARYAAGQRMCQPFSYRDRGYVAAVDREHGTGTPRSYTAAFLRFRAGRSMARYRARRLRFLSARANLLPCLRSGRGVVMSNHPASVALYNEHCEAGGTGFVILFLARKIIKTSHNYGILSENNGV